ncbi:ABC transporter permease [Rhodocaloribacter litoris]|uniref:ABC transporter permease n=1 Tax=Rhodocaloribacter litoris TaxID=2558931 RepID=UPI00142454CC|nr:ABC transporter permease [Rhodocaloribacter litoris]QXD14170.1 ABC transporter permease [Rhodocaloribacter litoris]
MHKIWIVLKSEFRRRVRTKWFILTTLLGPVALVAFFAIVGVVAVSSMEDGGRIVAVVDETGRLLPRLLVEPEDGLRLVAVEGPADSVRAAVMAGQYDGYLRIPAGVIEGAGEVIYYSPEGGGLGIFQSRLERLVREAVEQERLAARNVPPEVLEILRARVPVRMVRLTEAGETAGSTGAYVVIGFIMGFLIYMAMLIYGSVVMQGVIEEKTSRVVEVIVSSVRPFHLLMGKVLGIGAMGLVQMVVWALIILAGTMFSGTLLALFLDPAAFDLPDDASQRELLAAANFTVPQLSPDVFVWFVLFFLVGYLLYASLFAAIGSAVEQQQDAQSLLFPVMMPLILSIVFIQPVIEAPNSTLALVLSMVPFFSPIPMVVRVAVTEVPFWQVSLSFLLLLGTFVASIWVSARIYRVGILMYGKKPGLKDLLRWIRYA